MVLISDDCYAKVLELRLDKAYGCIIKNKKCGEKLSEKGKYEFVNNHEFVTEVGHD